MQEKAKNSKMPSSFSQAKRIRVRYFEDVKRHMKNFQIPDLGEFFICYETKNQEITREEALRKMREFLKAMRLALEKAHRRPNVTASGLLQGGAHQMNAFMNQGNGLLGGLFSEVIRNALAVSEHSACMGRIVAAPTAGSCGVLPAALVSVADCHKIPDDRIVQALFVAGGIGEIIAAQASLAGASHGCQAENGSASAMAAAGLAYLFKTDSTTGGIAEAESAAAFALKNLLGLVCDPIAGLVEVPCVKRNVVAALNALAAAEMALAGIHTVIPLDEVIQAMARVGETMPPTLRETAEGGLAATPTGMTISKNFHKDLG